MARKWPSVSILGIYTKSNNHEWNNWLTACVKRDDFNTLLKTYYGLQVDMDDLTKRKMNFDKVNLLFIRLTRSIEKTMKKMWRIRFYNINMPIEEKRKLDAKFETFLTKSRF